MGLRKREWQALAIYCVLLLLVTSIPYLVGYFSQSDRWVFTGFLVGVEDGNSYIAKMLNGGAGEWLFRSPYTTYPQSGVIAFLPYLILGKLSGAQADHNILVFLFHLFRLAAIPFVVVATYLFSAIFLGNFFWRLWATILATIGGGLGWILLATGNIGWLGSPPLEFYSPETFGFLGLFSLPHLTLARALLLFALWLYLTSVDYAWRAWFSGVVLLILLLVQPLSIATAAAVIFAHLFILAFFAWRTQSKEDLFKWSRAALRTLILPMPLTMYYVYRFSLDPYLRIWTEQNIILSPNFLHYLVAFALVLLPAVLGIVQLVRDRNEKGYLLIGWLFIFPFLAYAPHNLQRRLPDGIWVAIAILAALGLVFLARSVRQSRRLGIVLLALACISTISFLLVVTINAGSPAEPIFRTRSEVNAGLWLKRNSETNAVVLADFSTSNAVPAWADVQVLIGHGPESANVAELENEIKSFFSPSISDDRRIAFLESHEIHYLMYGPREKRLGGWNPEQSYFLNRVFQEDDYEVYRVELE